MWDWGPGLSCFPIYVCSPLLVSSFPGPHGFRKQKFFSLLCHYQEIIICCSVFHTDNQEQLPHGEFKNRTSNLHLQHFPIYIRCCHKLQLEFVFQNTLKGIYQLSLTSRATIMVVQRLALKHPGPEPAVSQPSPASESIILFNPGSQGCKSPQ